MNNRACAVAGFIAGIGAGVVGCYFAMKRYFEIKTQEEVDSVKEFYNKRHTKKSVEEVEKQDSYEDKVEEKEILERYSSLTSRYKSDDAPSLERIDMPYVISPDEFGEMVDYECTTLTYYADKILTDEENQIVEDVDETIGEESLERFGEFVDDCVYVRNDARKSDYEVLLDQRTYKECKQAGLI